MHLYWDLVLGLALAAGAVASSFHVDSPEVSTIDINPAVDPLYALAQLQQHAYETLQIAENTTKRSSRACSLETTTVRKDWYTLSARKCPHLLTRHRERMAKAERKGYIRAVQCLQTLPSKSDPAWAPAAKSRYDDFVAVHVNQTMFIHGNGLFLTWHRYFVWAYEQALRDECGYNGYQPVGPTSQVIVLTLY
jgi:tyrosinase